VRVRPVLATVAVVLLAGCGTGDHPTATTATATTDIRKPPEAGAVLAALAPLPGGGLRAGELTTGVVRDVLPRGTGRTLVTLPVSTGGQRGLLGLTVDARGRTFAAFTTKGAGERLVVEQVLPGPRRRVWTGPTSTDLADGGHLVRAADGRLLIGIGDLQAPQRTPRADTPNGKLLSLDPDGPASQRPRILSRGWNNPYAFEPTGSDGGVLVADNAPGLRAERIARGDAGGGAPRQVTELSARIAPSGLAVLTPDAIVVCGVRSGRLTRFTRRPTGWRPAGDLGPCAFGVARLSDGRLAVSTAAGVRVVSP
jgi:hypothetical protein